MADSETGPDAADGRRARSLLESDRIKAEIAELEARQKARVRQLEDLREVGEQLNEVLTRGFLPLYTLHLLSERPRHGNDLLREIDERSEGLWQPSSGGIYSLLKKLEKRGWIEGEWEEGETRAKRTYRLTPVGESVLGSLLEIVPPRVAATHRALELVALDLMANPHAPQSTDVTAGEA